MNKLIGIVMLLFASILVNGQSINKNEYVGTWNAVIKDTPNGDSKLDVKILNKDGKLLGTVTSEEDGTVEIKKIEVNEKSITISFKHGWFTVSLEMEKTDKNHCKCRLADRYNGIASRKIS